MIWITGGGTGGHLFPAWNIARELRRRHPAWPLHYIGAARGLEARRRPPADFDVTLLPVAGDLRRGIGERIDFYRRLAASLWRCERLYRRTRPRLVVGTGGYASFPAAQVALWHDVPLYWQEQNAQPGQVTIRVAARAACIFAGFAGLAERFPGVNVLHTGNPVPGNIASGDRLRGRQAGGFAPEETVLLVLGGSGGARSLNEAVARIWNVLNRQGGVRIWWQIGEREYDEWTRRIAPETFGGTMTPFIEQMADAYAAADFVVARAGAMTTAEICAAGKPAILVPFPYAAADHQTRNTEALVKAGAALMVTDHELAGEKLAETILDLTADATLRARLGAAARRLGRPGALEAIVDHLEAQL
jgi:UDP-N-acetylglucosamine--N-acetylmuramyl-(pentapeptide) pyrophosphoryl-undecaprenol N-acetylglucosamine transferase